MALDWGTTSLRAYLLGDDGMVLDWRSEPLGILQVKGADFEGVFAAVTAEWRAPGRALPAIASGMIGSAQGWLQAPYVDVPADVGAVARAIAIEPRSGLRIVPGLAQRGTAPDVMRGEETQLFGAMTQSPLLAREGTVVLPGTHSKWARISDGRVVSFATYMTGELFAVLRSHSILGRLAEPTAALAEAPGAAFQRGVRAASGSPGLTSVLFSARSAVLVGDLPAAECLEYLSGLLIGDEVRSALARQGRPRAIIGEPALCGRYVAALRELGAGEVDVLGDTAAAGLWHIGRHAFPELQRADGSSRSPVSDRVR